MWHNINGDGDGEWDGDDEWDGDGCDGAVMMRVYLWITS